MRKIDGVSCYGSAYEGQNYYVIFEHDNGYGERVCCDCSLMGWDRVVPFLEKYFKVVGKIVEISAI
jgi:hypothetical protein